MSYAILLEIILIFHSIIYLFTCQLNSLKANYQVGTRKLKEQKIDTNKQDNKVNLHLISNFHRGRDHKMLSSLKKKENYVHDATK
jgi:predicted Holliday junction resolvase-like endonuclease